MKSPILSIHVIEDPQYPPALKGNSAVVVHKICRQAWYAIPVQEAHRAALHQAAYIAMERLRSVVERYPVSPQRGRMDLDVLVFQSTPEHSDAVKCRGVMGFYCNGIDDPFTVNPLIELSVIAGHEQRLGAAALHELGHYLRSRATWVSGDLPFIDRAFEEGLCEHLVEMEFGAAHVIHGGTLGPTTLGVLQGQLRDSERALADSQDQPEFTEEAYRLGYHVVRELLEEQHSWASLLSISLVEARSLMHSGLNRLLVVQARLETEGTTR